MKLTPDSLAAHLAERLLPAYLVSGDEPLLTGEAADAVRAAARARGFTEREVHFIERAADWEAVRASTANLSLFGSRRVLEIRLTTARPGTAGGAALRALAQSDDPDTLLLVCCPRLEREAQSAEWLRAIEARGAWLAAWPVEPQRLPAWLRSRAQRMKLDLEEEALALLAARTEGNLLAAHQELLKLTLLAPAGQVTVQELRSAVADSARFDVFQLGEAVLGGEVARALRLLAGLRAEGTEPTLVLWALVRALREAWSVREGTGRGGSGWQRNAAVLARAAQRAPRLPFAALNSRAARADRMAKGRLSGDCWDEMALLACELCARPVMPPAALLRA
ncbi:MAG: DNA polymerase III subunit delta [Proteobacteria bacterium]|nr:DNA polymerase III subunit delta [Pseudomonadota bacterium]